VREKKGRPPVSSLSLPPLAVLIRELRAHGAEIDLRSVRAPRTRLKITLQVAEADQEWVQEVIASSGEDASTPPGETTS
jgi:hypothetical protein